MKQWISQNRGWLGIALVALALVVWVLTGERSAGEATPPQRSATVKVALTTSRAQEIQRVVTVQGHVEPEQTVQVRAKTGGEVVEAPVEEGAAVTRGALIARLDLDDREARLTEARAALRRAEGDFRAAEQMADRGFQAQLEAERARADLEAARARLAAIELDIEHTSVRAPIDGVLNVQIARQGDYVTDGDPVAEIVQNDPLRAVVQIPQHRVGEVVEGQLARVTFLDGEVREGRVRYVSAKADQQTRTFLARVRVDNPDRDLPAGISVTVEIPVETVRAHPISPALISQDEHGALGVKIAETVQAANTAPAIGADRESEANTDEEVAEKAQNIVRGQTENGLSSGSSGSGLRARFVPVVPVRAEASRVWVTGLPDEARLITRGQGFVRDGDRIEVGGDGAP